MMVKNKVATLRSVKSTTIEATSLVRSVHDEGGRVLPRRRSKASFARAAGVGGGGGDEGAWPSPDPGVRGV